MSRGYEKNEPREVVVKLRLTASEANVLSSIAERAERPITKVVLSAITTTCAIAALNNQVIRMGHKGFSALREEFGKLYYNTTDEKERADMTALLTLLLSLEDTIFKYSFDCEDWINQETQKPWQDQLPLSM
jgi:hypothetical protein